MIIQEVSDFESVFCALGARDYKALRELFYLHPNEFIKKVLIDDNSFVFALILDENRSEFCEQLASGNFNLLSKTIDYAALNCERMCREFIKRNRCF